jgi:hypothetical protein
VGIVATSLGEVHDAGVVIPRLSGSERAWLAAAIAKDTPDHHELPLLAHQERA